MVEAEKRIIIIAGPNGAGKTTLANQILAGDQAGFPFVNADIIARGLNPDTPEAEAFRAGRLMLQRLQELVDQGTSFACETTLSGRGFARAIPGWQSLGYRVELHFLSLSSPEDSISRVARRVRQGGHYVPDDVVRRRFQSGMANFHQLYKGLVDSWILYDNSSPTLIVLDRG